MKKKEIVEELVTETVVTIAPITESFSNGELNVLRDKINELIARTN